MLPPHTLLVEDFYELRDLIQSWINGHYELMVILGDGGLGKSETIERMMYANKGKANRKWGYIKGYIAPLKLYQLLYEFRLLPIFFNDVDTLFKNEINVSLMKCVCDTAKVKVVGWTSTHSAFGSLPQKFESISPVMVVTNSWEKVSQNIKALHNRGVVIHFRPTASEIHREVAEGGWFDDQEVWEFIGRNLFLMTRPDLRFYIHTRNHKRAGLDWEDLCLRMMVFGVDEESGETRDEKEKLIYVARLLADPKYDAMPAGEGGREEIFQIAFPRGGSRATYHRYKRMLLKRRGNFDPKVIAAIQWKGPSAVPTVFETKQIERRECLEQERRALELAGGVFGDDEDDEDI